MEYSRQLPLSISKLMTHNNMRFLLFFLCMYLNLSDTFSQKLSKDTLSFGKVVHSSWGIQFSAGSTLHQKLNQEIVNNRIASTIGLTLNWKNLNLSCDGFFLNFNPTREILFNNIPLDSRTSGFKSFNLNTALDYNYNFHRNWGTTLRLGINITELRVTKPVFINTTLKSDVISGAIIGLGVNRYTRLKRFNYLVSGLRVDYYSTNYSRLSPNLSRSSLNYSLFLAYKAWFIRIIE